MTDITEQTAEKLEEIRQRYRPTEVPKCHICGAEMTIQCMSASRITYGCAGAIYDETGCHHAEGRSFADDHYAESRITVVDVSDPDVLALVEALEKAQATEAHCNRGWMEAHEQEARAEVAEKRIVELESRTVKLPKPISVLHRREFTEAHCAIYAYPEAEVNAALDEVGIKWESA